MGEMSQELMEVKEEFAKWRATSATFVPFCYGLTIWLVYLKISHICLGNSCVHHKELAAF